MFMKVLMKKANLSWDYREVKINHLWHSELQAIALILFTNKQKGFFPAHITIDLTCYQYACSNW